MQPINTSLEEADNRVVLYIRDTMLLWIKREILVRTVDSDVIVILLVTRFLHSVSTIRQECHFVS